jgi:hypothetical protein
LDTNCVEKRTGVLFDLEYDEDSFDVAIPGQNHKTNRQTPGEITGIDYKKFVKILMDSYCSASMITMNEKRA